MNTDPKHDWKHLAFIAMVLTIVALSVAILTAGPAQAGSLDPAVVMVRDCSGVCVNPSGLVLSVKHGDFADIEQVRFGNRVVNAKRVYVSPDAEGPVAFDCDGDGYPFALMALSPPNVGEKVWTAGYPVSNGQRLFWSSGKMLGRAQMTMNGVPWEGNAVSFPSSGGMSGGPLFNDRGEVAGILSSTNNKETVFVSFRATRLAYDTCRPNRNPILRVFMSAACQPCILFKRHLTERPAFRQRIEQRYTIIFVDVDKEPAKAREAGITEAPTFIREGSPPITGYVNPDDLVDRLEGVRERPAAQPTTPSPIAPPVSPPAAPIAPPVAVQPPASTPTPPAAPPAVPPKPTLGDRIDRLTGLVSTGLSVASWLGLTGATGGVAGAVLGGVALWRTFRKVKSAVTQPTPVVTQQPPQVPPSPPAPPVVIATENPPPPQAVYRETRYAAYEVDTFSEAFAYAERAVAEKYPKSLEVVSFIRSVINQYLSAKGVRPNG